VTDDLGNALRRLAAGGPSDEGLLAGVHAASARAAVRRRATISSAAAFVVLAAGALVGNLGDAPAGDALVLGSASSPAEAPMATPDPTAAVGPTPAPTTTLPAPERTIPPGTYGGRAVSPEGKPIEGLYVYAIPALKPGWTSIRPAARTDEHGQFEIPCPDGAVMLSAWELGTPQDGSTPNWRTTFTAGGHRLEDTRPPACTAARQDTTVPEGSVLYGALRGPCDLTAREVRVTLRDDYAGDHVPGHVVRDLGGLTTSTTASGSFRLAGLPPGSYDASARGNQEPKHVMVRKADRYEVLLELSDEGCASGPPSPDASPSAEPGISPSPEPEVTPTPEPEVT